MSKNGQFNLIFKNKGAFNMTELKEITQTSNLAEPLWLGHSYMCELDNGNGLKEFGVIAVQGNSGMTDDLVFTNNHGVKRESLEGLKIKSCIDLTELMASSPELNGIGWIDLPAVKDHAENIGICWIKIEIQELSDTDALTDSFYTGDTKQHVVLGHLAYIDVQGEYKVQAHYYEEGAYGLSSDIRPTDFDAVVLAMMPYNEVE